MSAPRATLRLWLVRAPGRQPSSQGPGLGRPGTTLPHARDALTHRRRARDPLTRHSGPGARREGPWGRRTAGRRCTRFRGPTGAGRGSLVRAGGQGVTGVGAGRRCVTVPLTPVDDAPASRAPRPDLRPTGLRDEEEVRARELRLPRPLRPEPRPRRDVCGPRRATTTKRQNPPAGSVERDARRRRRPV